MVVASFRREDEDRWDDFFITEVEGLEVAVEDFKVAVEDFKVAFEVEGITADDETEVEGITADDATEVEVGVEEDMTGESKSLAKDDAWLCHVL